MLLLLEELLLEESGGGVVGVLDESGVVPLLWLDGAQPVRFAGSVLLQSVELVPLELRSLVDELELEDVVPASARRLVSEPLLVVPERSADVSELEPERMLEHAPSARTIAAAMGVHVPYFITYPPQVSC